MLVKSGLVPPVFGTFNGFYMLLNLSEKDLKDVKQAADYLGYSESLIRRKCRNGDIKAVKKGNSWVITDYDLKHYKANKPGRPTR